VPDCGLRLAEECDLVVCGASERLVLPARVVYVDAQRGAGLELVGYSLEMKARIAALEPIAPPDPAPTEAPQLEESDPDCSPLDDAALDRIRHRAVDDIEAVDSKAFPSIVLDALDDDLAIREQSSRGRDRDGLKDQEAFVGVRRSQAIVGFYTDSRSVQS